MAELFDNDPVDAFAAATVRLTQRERGWGFIKLMRTGSDVQVLVTSASFDWLNTNAVIRTYLFDALRTLLGPGAVAVVPLERAVSVISDLEPRLLVVVGSLASDLTDHRRLRSTAERAGTRVACWLHDDPYEFDYSFKCDVLADFVFSNDRWAVEHYRHPETHFLPLAGALAMHHRPLTPVQERDFAFFFCGVAYPNRIDLFHKADALLCRYPVAVFGAQWPSNVHCARNRRLTPAQMSDFAARSRLTLNCGRDLNIANRRFALPASTPGPRTFEIALSGSAQLYFASDLEILDHFELNSEVLLVDSVTDIQRAIERAYDDPAAIEMIAHRAQVRALRDHTYENRAKRLLAIAMPNLVPVETLSA